MRSILQIVRVPVIALAYAVLLAFGQIDESGPSAGTHTASELRVQHRQVLDALNVRDAKGELMALDDPRLLPLVLKGWRLAGEWAAIYLNVHPDASERELQRIFEDFAPKPKPQKSKYGNYLEYAEYFLEGSAVRITPSVFVVEASYGTEVGTSTFMVVAREEGGQFEALWSIKDVAAKHYRKGDELGRWMYPVSDYNGPLSVGQIIPLPSKANGRPRFVVAADEHFDGSGRAGQVSIWEWDGRAANSLLIHTYEYSDDTGGVPKFDGHTLRIPIRERPHSFSSCGSCPEPHGVWTIRITPTGVKDLGHRFVEPEYHWADVLLTRVGTRNDVSHWADPAVVDALREHIHAREEEYRRWTKDYIPESFFSWGMIESLRVFQRGQHGRFILDLDEGRLSFTYELRRGHPYFKAVHIQ